MPVGERRRRDGDDLARASPVDRGVSALPPGAGGERRPHRLGRGGLPPANTAAGQAPQRGRLLGGGADVGGAARHAGGGHRDVHVDRPLWRIDPASGSAPHGTGDDSADGADSGCGAEHADGERPDRRPCDRDGHQLRQRRAHGLPGELRGRRNRHRAGNGGHGPPLRRLPRRLRGRNAQL